MRKLQPGERVVWVRRKWGVQKTSIGWFYGTAGLFGSPGDRVFITAAGRRALAEAKKGK